MIPFWCACCTARQTTTKSSSRRGDRELFAVTEVGDRHAADQFHDEIGPASIGGTGIMDLGDVGMVHHGEGLPLGLEAGNDLPRIHAGLDDLQSHLAAHGIGLQGDIDNAHAAFANLFRELVGTDDRTWRIQKSWVAPAQSLGRFFKKLPEVLVRGQ